MNKLTLTYKNELNTIPLRKFNKQEMDLFFLLCNKIEDNKTDYLRFYFYELQSISSNYINDKNKFIKDLEVIQKKLLKLSYREEDNNEIKLFSLFQGFIINKKYNYVELSLSKDVKYVLVQITNEFSPTELKNIIELSSNYSKIIYRLLIKYKNQDHYKIKIEDFKSFLHIPDSYRMSDITRQILKPTEKDLSNVYSFFKIEKIKSKKRNEIEYIEFIYKT